MQENETDFLLPFCAFPKTFSTIHFLLLCFSSCVALVGICCNLLLLAVFCLISEPILAILSVLDAVLCFCYMILFGVENVAYYLRIPFLYSTFFAYNLYGFALSRATQLAIPAMLILTSIRRWTEVSKSRHSCWRLIHNNVYRLSVGLIVVFISCAVRLPMLWAIKMYSYNCSDLFRTKQLGGSMFYMTPFYRIFDLILTVFQVFVPFVCLIVVNLAVVFKLRTIRKKAQREFGQPAKIANMAGILLSILSPEAKEALSDAARNEQNAISSTAIIVSTYLVCNSFHVVLVVVERWITHLVQDGQNWTDFYTISRDAISFLFMFCSAIRLPIYYQFNPRVQSQLRNIMHKCKRNKSKKIRYDSIVRHQTSFSQSRSVTFSETLI